MLFHYPHYGHGLPQSALVIGSHKIIRDLESGAVQLFDLEKDLSEAHNLAESKPEKAAELNQLLSARLKRVGAQMPSLNPDYTPSASRDRWRPGARRGGRPSGPRRLRGI